MRGGVIPHHQQKAYDRGHEDGWQDGYEIGTRTMRLRAAIGFAMGALAVVACQTMLGWFS